MVALLSNKGKTRLLTIKKARAKTNKMSLCSRPIASM